MIKYYITYTHIFILFLFTYQYSQGQAISASLSGRSLLIKADSLINIQSLESAQEVLSLASAQALREKDTLSYLQSLNKKAYTFSKQAQYDSSLIVARASIQLMHELPYTDPILLAELSRSIGLVYELRDNDLSKAAEEYQKGLKVLNSLEGDKPYLSIELSKDLVIILLTKGLIDSASTALDTIINSQEIYFSEKHMELADTYRLKAVGLSISNYTIEAIKYYNKALSSLNKAKKSKRTQKGKADILGNIGNLHHLSGYYDSAFIYYSKQKNINEIVLSENDKSLANLYRNLSSIHQFKGYYDSAIYYARKSLNITELTLSKNHPDLAESYSALAITLQQEGKIQESLVYYSKSFEIIESNFGLNHWRTYNVLSQLGIAQSGLGDYTKSNEYFKQAISIGLNGDFANIESIVRNHLYLADNFIKIGDLEKANKAISKANELTHKLPSVNHQIFGEVQIRKGVLYNQQKNPLKAEESFLNAYKSFINIFGERHPRVGEILIQLAKLKIENQELVEAKELLWKAILSNTYEYEEVKLGVVPRSYNIINPLQTIQSLELLAKVEWEISETENDLSFLQKSRELYDTLLNLLAEILFETTQEEDLAQIIKLFHANYSSAINLLYEMKEKGILDEQEYLENHFNYSEASKGIVTSYSLFKHKALKSFKGKSNQVDSLRSITKEASFVKSQITTFEIEYPNNENLKYYQDWLFNLLNKKRQILSKLESEETTFKNFLEESMMKSVDIIQKEVGYTHTIIEYFLTDDKLFTLLIKKNETKVSAQTLNDNFLQQISNHQSLKNNDIENYARGSRALYDILIAPIKSDLKDIEKLLIIPDKTLWNVNFGLLLTDDKEHIDTKKLPYLLKDYQISYAYAVKLMGKNPPKQEQLDNKKVLALAYGDDNGTKPQLSSFRNTPLAKIRGTAFELKAIEKLVDGDFIYGQKATEALFKEKSSEYGILHLAMHGVMIDSSINESYLAFFADSLQEEDGRLYPFELTELDLSADLAVLSACETGAGKIVNGEGVMSIGRGFFNAGVKSLLLTQWPLSDAVAPEIMESFYQYLNKGIDKDEALRSAQLDFLENANNISANPYYWGSFFILGDTEPIDFRPRTPRWYYIVVASILLFLAVLALRKKKRRGQRS
ncbi:CHAT domain-containing protein [Roseivirga ehrenbergii]|uniref:CHAT domain-containing protein n=1 Tax=Roseivirga ehrenbergii (strain DSM 102268 / JCM 13514 / KCTC 12282 / NCIMB 14502 / KMM 6017) TaxID=279360 RepID=A0A150XRX9_ROSEK|nr:CHAT domain-containing protein [Roseivirga ehrenbergii]KYG81518.1 hypothetical protein MB14_13090 [Roseivirga ehrenbergii]TCL10677.1 CHAT domain-containing protein [Roseivirga ehrenbergii]